MHRFSLSLLIMLWCVVVQVKADVPLIVMAYKDEAKPPLIGERHDNSGVYLDIFSRAAAAIGHQLKVVRIPKKRLYLQLEAGALDFYPGSSFSPDRSEYLVFLENGLETKEVLISRADHPDVQKLADLSGTLLVDLGGSKEKISAEFPSIETFAVASLDFEQSLSLISLARVDYYIADIEEVESYAADMGIESFAEIGIKIHHNALGGFQPMYMGFSQKSPLMKLKANADYDASKPLSYENMPVTAHESSVAYRLHKALMALKSSGELDKIVAQHASK